MTTIYNTNDEYTCALERLFYRWNDYDRQLYRAAKEVMRGSSTAEQAACEYDIEPEDIEDMADELYAYEAALTALTLQEPNHE